MAHGLVERDQLDKRTETNIDAQDHLLVRPGDLAYNMMRMWQGAVGLASFEGNVSPAYVVLEPKQDVDSEFAYYYLKDIRVMHRLWSYSYGLTNDRLRLYFKDFAKIPMAMPPLQEQVRIADILKTWDMAVQRLVDLRSAITRRRTWLRSNIMSGKRRLPGFTAEWQVMPLHMILEEHGLKSKGCEEVFSVSVAKGLVNQVDHLGRSYAARSTDHYNRVLPGDIVYTKSPTGDFPYGIIKQSRVSTDAIVSPLYGVFTPKNHYIGHFLDAYFESPVTTWNYLHPLVQKGAKNTISITNSGFLKGKLSLPTDEDELRAITEIVEDSYAELAGIEKEVEKLKSQKLGLMQKLLSDNRRVSAEAA